MTKSDKKDRSHLKVVEPEKEIPQAEESPENNSTYLYDKLSEELSGQYLSGWDEYITDNMDREEFIRTFIELDELDFAHPVISYDSVSAPTAKKPMLTPGKYELLNLENITKEEEDAILWSFECEERDYRVVFIPKTAVYKIEKMLQQLVKKIVEEGGTNSKDDFDPAAALAFIREFRIFFNDEVSESGFLDDDSYDEDDDDFEGFENEDYSNEDFDIFYERIQDRIKESIENASLTRMDFGRYKVTMLFT